MSFFAAPRASLRLGTALAPHVRHSHIGSALLSVPAGISISELPFPPLSNPLRAPPAALRHARSLLVAGPKGKVVVPLQAYVQMRWLAAEGAEATKETAAAAAAAAADAGQTLQLSVVDSRVKTQRATWGLTRALLANALTGVSAGHAVQLKLVGVGYRATLEEDPFPRASALSLALASSRASFASPQQRLTYQAFAAEEEAARTTHKPMRLNIKLGYSHPVIMPVPHGIDVNVPQPTVIELRGVDRENLGLFASQIRAWRRPEPYKGKGIFVNGETIKLRTAKKK
ncbi:hypothetical protein FA09DRAFT_314615 [Tilletiopsis washingtonensis]|uniref:Large ribosomal subunit protein uL6 alpha-beta domain-containing protein n=1 Tax=Tilletiopsis washingtonensis TaxID=58919 RepID=A0A316ZIT4_9BASI|nr:hypothetical protein FA09DRAFT_314615 [Tilletiopsis washingtonensis]PWO00863.1 hypothetical protein FA09DRAFT_314615 [Tilletiopsis washingtonensis]